MNPAMILIDLFVSACVVWYIAYAVTSTHGPWLIFDRTRKITTLGGLLECPVCAAPWIAAGLMLVRTGGIDLVQVFAVAGLAMLMHGWTGWRFGG